MKRIAAAVAVIALPLLSQAAPTNYSAGRWTVSYDDATHMVSFTKDGQPVLHDVYAKFKLGATEMNTTAYANVEFKSEDVTPATGAARKYTITYKAQGAMPTVEQAFYLMSDKDYLLTDVTLVGDGAEVASNYICPVYSEAQNLFLPQDANNRFLTVPFDNDEFVTYGCYPLSRAASRSSYAAGRFARDSISFEVTSIFNGETQKGMVLGSVTHDTWKSAVRLTGSPLTQGYISKLELFSGVTHVETRDRFNGAITPHGTVRGKSVKSALMMVGLFDDWRVGMETYGDVNAQIAPKRPYNGPTIYGWNSWGGMEKHCNYKGAMSVSDFIKDKLMDKGWGKNGVVYVGLDSWDNMSWAERKAFADKCHANGQKAGAYWTPWTDWNGNDSRPVEGNGGFTYAQNRVKVNGKVDHHRYDPTCPAMKSLIDYQIGKFKECGFDYLKLDFMCSGIKEADSFYEPGITTGVQAYNYGMDYLRKACGDDIFLDLSIAPLFPAQYAEGRRISCDAWGEMWHTSYMMNSLSFGWWLNRVYCYNDPDHLVMGDRSEGENMSRITTAAVTGYCILGDNLSTKGSYIGSPRSQERCVKYTGNERVNEIIDMGVSFRPAYGHKLYGPNNTVDMFYHEAEDSWVIAHFNYGVGDKNVELDLTTLGIDAIKLDLARSFDCWTNDVPVVEGNVLKYKSLNDRPRLWRLFKK
ncbi:MAG: hypothetical protein KBT09_00855 [Bacteroidales bacterium]|nr:hypothetical protein [Candidatus Sodaliphilus fimicaballi]